MLLYTLLISKTVMLTVKTTFRVSPIRQTCPNIPTLEVSIREMIFNTLLISKTVKLTV